MTPVELQIWNAQECAEYIGVTLKKFQNVIQFKYGFPSRCEIPGRPRWRAAEVMAWQPTPRKTYLYRHYNDEGKLLYVGIALSHLKRMKEHKQYSPWFDDIATIKIEKYPNRLAAEEAERIAIESENPMLNQMKVKK